MGTTTLRPNGNSYTPGFAGTTYSSGGSAYPLLNDNSDASYVVAGGFTVEFDDPSLPAGSVVKSVTPRVRAAVPAGSASVRVAVGTGAGASWLTDVASDESIALTATPTTYTFAAQPWSYAGGPWSAADINALQMWVSRVTATTLRTYEAYLDVLYADVPTVSNVTVTNPNTSTPTYGWDSLAGADGGPLTLFEVKAFDSVTYGGGGFSPDTSVPIYATSVLSAGMSLLQPAGYLGTATYKVYVRVAQSTLGTTQYSTGGVGLGWAVSSAFTPVPDPPAPPTLTVTPDSANSRVTLTIQGHDNLLTEQSASVETAASTGEWAALTNCAVAQSTTQAIAPGTGSLRMSSSAAGDMEARFTPGLGFLIPAVAGRTYRIRGSARAGGTTRSVKAGIAWFNAAGSIIGTAAYSSTVSATNAGFTEALADLVAPANTAYMVPRPYVVGCAGASELFYWDHLAIQEGAATLWSRGGLQSPGNGYVATGDKRYAVTYQDAGGSVTPLYGAGALADGTNQTVTFQDLTWTPGVARTYFVRAYYTQGGNTTDGATATGSPTATLDTTTWTLADVVLGTTTTLEVLADNTKEYGLAQGVFQVLDAEHDIVTSGTRKAPTGTLVVRTRTLIARDAFVTDLRSTATRLLRGPSTEDGGSRWVQLGTYTIDREVPEIGTEAYRLFTIPYRVVNGPV